MKAVIEPSRILDDGRQEKWQRDGRQQGRHDDDARHKSRIAIESLGEEEIEDGSGHHTLDNQDSSRDTG